jgi:hypothetical protein
MLITSHTRTRLLKVRIITCPGSDNPGIGLIGSLTDDEADHLSSAGERSRKNRRRDVPGHGIYMDYHLNSRENLLTRHEPFPVRLDPLPTRLNSYGLLSALFTRSLRASSGYIFPRLDAESAAQAGNSLGKDLADAPLAQIKYLSDFP